VKILNILSKLPIFISISMLSVQADEVELGKWTFDNQNLESSEVNTLLNSLGPLEMNSTAVYDTDANSSTGGGFRFFNKGDDGEWLQGSKAHVIPDTDDDGYGFGGNNGEDVMFLHRADFKSGDNEERDGQYTSFGPAAANIGHTAEDGDGNAPMRFTVTAADQDITITGLKFELERSNTANLAFSLQDPDGAAATSPYAIVPSIATSETKQEFAAGTFTVSAGDSKTFTIALDSGSKNSAHTLNEITLYGHVYVPEICSSSLIMGLFVVMSLTASRRLYYKASL
jgi:hypothetical protein